MRAFGPIRPDDKFRIPLVAEIDVADEMSEKLGGSAEWFELHDVLIKRVNIAQF